MEYVRHGGACCGISHVRSFDGATVADLDRILERHDNEHEHGTPGNRLLEAVLSERQVNREANRRTPPLAVSEEIWRAGGWPSILIRRGFRLVSRFNNSNSGNNCYIYHRVTRPLSTTDGLPYEVLGEEPAPAPVVDHRLVIPADWRHHPEDILEFHDGSRFRIAEVNQNVATPYLTGRVIAPRGRSVVLPSGLAIAANFDYSYYINDGQWSGDRADGAIRNIRRDQQAPELPEVVEPQQEAPEGEWVRGTRDNVVLGARVRYVYDPRENRGAELRRRGFEGVVTEDGPILTIETTNNHQVQRLRPARVDAYRLVDVFVPAVEPAPEPAPEPAVTRSAFFCVFTGGRRGTVAFDTIEAARARWPRCRNHVRVDYLDDGTTTETEING